MVISRIAEIETTTANTTSTMAGQYGEDRVQHYDIWDATDYPNGSEQAFFDAFSAGQGSNASSVPPALVMTQQNVVVDQPVVIVQYSGEGGHPGVASEEPRGNLWQELMGVPPPPPPNLFEAVDVDDRMITHPVPDSPVLSEVRCEVPPKIAGPPTSEDPLLVSKATLLSPTLSGPPARSKTPGVAYKSEEEEERALLEAEVLYRKAALEMRKAEADVCRAELEARAAEVKLRQRACKTLCSAGQGALCESNDLVFRSRGTEPPNQGVSDLKVRSVSDPKAAPLPCLSENECPRGGKESVFNCYLC